MVTTHRSLSRTKACQCDAVFAIISDDLAIDETVIIAGCGTI